MSDVAEVLTAAIPAQRVYTQEREAVHLRCRICQERWFERWKVVPIMGEPGSERLISLPGRCGSSPPHEGTAEIR